MLREEYGFPAEEASPWRGGLATYIGFMLAGLIPLLPYISQAIIPVVTIQPFLWSIILAGLTFFAIGAAKSRFVDQRWHLSGSETLVIGGIAAGLAFVIGALLRSMADAIWQLQTKPAMDEGAPNDRVVLYSPGVLSLLDDGWK